ncbi:hypothetical protein ACI79D_13970 [Geodermatophilus sp. SYSU D00708]
MATVDQELHIHLPLWARVWIVVFLPVWLWIIFHQPDGPGLAGWLIAAFGVALGTRMFMMGAVGTADGRLTVRNQFTTRTFRRDELTDAVVDRADGRFGTGWTVWLVLRDGSRQRVQLTEVPFRSGFNGALERNAERLQAWIHAPGRPQPFE